MDKKASISVPPQKLAEFARKWKIEEISLFGSVLSDCFTQSSDIDVLVAFKPGSSRSLFDLVRMRDELEEMLGRDVDLIDRKSVESSRNYIRKREVLSSLETIYVTG
ncbi:MAG: nucleotidyltransferase [Candidatus Anoxymicrobium japonicum]|uniref:Nucleotidyltransferase n=1 Tax=Candidatus Anoxymicrobium japonicum TaxID=2013648 RepID=A0A2N3G5V6_9ACTN|nr:MAG: nucleotidyltransferase [Candidatus Anoxymicrobium japonicum]